MALLGLSWLQTTPSRVVVLSAIPPPALDDASAGLVTSYSSVYRHGRPRRVVFSIERFGGVGDGKTSNTEAFQRAMDHLKKFGDKGGSQLNVSQGRWVSGSFNLTSNFTLFLEKGAVILGSQNGSRIETCQYQT
ncbi:putative polygalacturonase [Cocos nucifera]|nr:putative polygalacturonase [Cocos nucifera]